METRPNILLMIADDLGKPFVGCYGNPEVRTPSLDALASQGMRFNRTYTPAPTCAPSRTAMLTGLGPHRSGCHMNWGEVRAGVKSLPHYLRALGYRVGIAGKTHFGPRENFPFEHFPFDDRDPSNTPTHRALDFAAIESFMTRDDGPFCLVVGSSEPHRPHGAATVDPQRVLIPPGWVDTPATRQTLASYYGDIGRLDAEVGRCMDLLEAHALTNRTLTVFGADHGYEMFAKWSCYEAGTNVPFIVRWPGRVAAGGVTDALVSYVDVLPTLLDAAGATDGPELDGDSFLPLLSGRARRHHDRVFSAHTNRGVLSGQAYPIRAVHETRWKYIRNLDPNAVFQNVTTHGMMWREQDAEPEYRSWVQAAEQGDEWARQRVKLFRRRPAEELYDLSRDPHELHNVAGSPDYAPELERLREALDDWMRRQGDAGLAAELAVPLYGQR